MYWMITWEECLMGKYNPVAERSETQIRDNMQFLNIRDIWKSPNRGEK
jgi:hypothetical protein